MKKIVALLILLFVALPVHSQQIEENSKPLECGVSFDWISKSQIQRDENIAQIQSILFNNNTVLKYPKKETRSKYADFLKDKDWKQHYIEISNGKQEDSEKKYSGFFMNNGWLYMYAFQYKNNPKIVYYYDTMGNLRYVDLLSDNYPNFPYYSAQYNMSGELVGTIYFVSSADQYIFKPDKTFKGRWYKEKMYNRNAKVIMTRSNY